MSQQLLSLHLANATSNKSIRSEHGGSLITSPVLQPRYSKGVTSGEDDIASLLFVNRASNTSSNIGLVYNYNNNNDGGDDFNYTDYMYTGKSSNLVRAESCDWSSDDMELEEAQMKKHLDHLQASSVGFDRENINVKEQTMK